MASEAFDKGAAVVGLPEFYTGRIAPSDEAFNIVLPAANKAIDMMVRLARKYGGRIGGSMLAADNGEIYNCYVLAEPDGKLPRHDKDLPTMWEHAFYIGGADRTEERRVGKAWVSTVRIRWVADH